MAQKKTYVYRLLIGNNDKTEVDVLMFARNAGDAIQYCKDKYKDKKYNSYQAIKVGVSHILRDTQIIDDTNAEKLRQAGADKGEKYSEREIDMPQFITKEEAEELDL